MTRTAALAALGLLLLAGCIGQSQLEVLDTPIPTNVIEDPTTGILHYLKPNLTQGRWWDVTLLADFGSGFVFDLNGKIVVSEKNENGFRLGSDQSDIAVLDTYFDSFYLGRLDNDLNPTMGGIQAKLFDWPLAVNKTWTTPFYGQGFDSFSTEPVTASFNVSAFDDDNTHIRIQGQTSSGDVLDYDYDPATGWMRYFRMYNATGRMIIGLEFERTGDNFTGPVHHLTSEALYARFTLFPPFGGGFPPIDPSVAPIPPAETFTVGPGFNFVEEISVLFGYSLCGDDFDPNLPHVCGGGGQAALVTVRPDNSQNPRLHTGEPGASTGKFNRDVVTEGFEGQWKVSYGSAGTAGLFVLVSGFIDDVVTL